MRFSLELPTQCVGQPAEFVTTEAITAVTRSAAAAGFAAVYVTDHPAPDARWLDQGGHHALDPFVALAVASAADPAIALQTNIYVAAYRNPFLGANSVLSLDVLSGGRVILGVAAGYLKPEFAALGADFGQRGDRLDEALAVLDAVALGDDVAWERDGVSARAVRFRPATPAGRRPPVWVGGNSAAAMRRAARFEGWAPFHTAGFARASRTRAIESTEDLRAAIVEVRDLAGESVPDRVLPFDVCWSESLVADGTVSTDHRIARVDELSSAGVTWMTVSLRGADRDELLAAVDSFGSDVIDHFAALEVR